MRVSVALPLLRQPPGRCAAPGRGGRMVIEFWTPKITIFSVRSGVSDSCRDGASHHRFLLPVFSKLSLESLK